MAFTEDLDQFFDTDDFAVPCSIDTTPPRSIDVIFSRPTESVSMYEAQVEAPAPFLLCKTGDLAGVRSGRSGNSATIDAVAYKIERIEHEGAGTSRVYLKT